MIYMTTISWNGQQSKVIQYHHNQGVGTPKAKVTLKLNHTPPSSPFQFRVTRKKAYVNVEVKYSNKQAYDTIQYMYHDFEGAIPYTKQKLEL